MTNLDLLGKIITEFITFIHKPNDVVQVHEFESGWTALPAVDYGFLRSQVSLFQQ